MQRLNAIDAISPAWNHTQQLLLAPRNWRLLLKIGAIAVLAQMGGCNLNLGSPGKFPHGAGGGQGSAMSPAALAIILTIVAGLFLLGIAFFYIGSRLQFVLFDVVLRRNTRIAPLWQRYGRVVWRWIGLKIAFFLVAALCLLPILLPGILLFIRSMPAKGSGAQPNTGSFLVAVLGFLGVIFVAILAIGICYFLLTDFGLPSMALEDVPIGETVRRIGRLIHQEPGQVALYLLMRFLLGLAFAMGTYILLLLLMLVLLIPLGGAAYVLYALLHQAGTGAYIMMTVGFIVLGLLLAAAFVLLVFVLFGFGFTFLQAYALYFLGGRYPLLGSLLEPGPGGPFTPPPVFPSQEESEDPDDGPPMPMNPAIA